MTYDIDSYLSQIYQNGTQPRPETDQAPPMWAPAWGYRRKKRKSVTRPSVGLAPTATQRYAAPAATANSTTASSATPTTKTGTRTYPLGSFWASMIAEAKKRLAAKRASTATTPTAAPSDAWRRQMPTDITTLLRQLSVNAGEMGMPGGYVGAVQLPAYGSGLSPVMNPNMTTYGQQPNIGEATFFQQSMKGGMAPIAAMSPLGVPENWKPIGTTTPTKTTTK